MSNSFNPTKFNWVKPNYQEVFDFRLEALTKIRKNPSAMPRLKKYYSENWVDFINDWGMTYDPASRLLNTSHSSCFLDRRNL